MYFYLIFTNENEPLNMYAAASAFDAIEMFRAEFRLDLPGLRVVEIDKSRSLPLAERTTN